MKADLWKRVRSIFEEAVELTSSADREAYLSRACGNDAAVRAEVEDLLRSDGSSDGFTHFIDSGIVGELVGGRLTASMSGARVGAYHVNRVLASGGMGTVYEATQENPRRLVALKMMRAGLASPDAVRRFRYECETLAHLRHPGIAQIYEAGTYRAPGRDEPVPFFAMEYVDGAHTIVEHAKARSLDTSEILKLFLDICDAVNDAHQRGVIHRDIKPANILVDSAGRPKIIDFGIARAVGASAPAYTLETQAGQIVGTVQYMSPEQAEGAREDVDTRTDIYALGVVLFQLLSGRMPYDFVGQSLTEVVRLVRDEPPMRLGSIVPSLAGDLEWIALKALEKEKARRYESAAALAEDIRRHLRHEPVLAGPPSTAYRVRKFVRRHRVAVAAATTVAVALVAGIAATSIALRRAIQAESDAQRQKARAETSLKQANGALDFLAEIFRAADPEKDGRDVRVVDRLSAAITEVGQRFADEPATEASVRAAIGNTYVGLGLFREGEEQLRLALACCERAGEHGREVIVDELNLATAIQYQGRLPEAETLDRRALEESRRILGSDSETSLTLAGNLAVVLKQQGKFDEAEEQYRNALDASTRVFGADYDLTLTLMGNFAELLIESKKRQEGEPLLRRALDARRRVSGDSHVETLTLMNNLANHLFEDGKDSEAEVLLREVSEKLSRVLGENHRDTLSSASSLAAVLDHEGRIDEALALSRDVLEKRRRTLGDSHEDVRATRKFLALLLRKAGRLSEAEDVARVVLAAATTAPAPARINDMNVLALILSEQGKVEEAEPLFREALETARAVVGDDAPTVLHLQVNLALCWVRAKRYEEAEEVLLRLYEPVVKATGAESLFAQKAARGLATIYEETGRPDQLATWRSKLVPESPPSK